MTTEALIAALAVDARPVRPLLPPAQRCRRWLALALPLVAALAAALGVRPDLADVLRDPRAWLEAVCLTTLGAAAARSAFQLGVPGVPRSAATFALPGSLLGLWLALSGLSSGGAAGLGLVDAGSGLACVSRLVSLGALPLAVSWSLLRRAAPLEPGWTGALLALSSFALAALGSRLVCARDGALHLLQAHCLPVLMLGGAAAVAARFTLARPVAASGALGKAPPASARCPDRPGNRK